MTREIELAAAVTRDITIRDEERAATWRQPMSKTDVTGQGVERTHGCAHNKFMQQEVSLFRTIVPSIALRRTYFLVKAS